MTPSSVDSPVPSILLPRVRVPSTPSMLLKLLSNLSLHCEKNKKLFYFICRLFKQTSLQFQQQIFVKKCPSRIRYWDSNPQLPDDEFHPITTRPGLPPYYQYYLSQPYSHKIHNYWKVLTPLTGLRPESSQLERSNAIYKTIEGCRPKYKLVYFRCISMLLFKPQVLEYSRFNDIQIYLRIYTVGQE